MALIKSFTERKLDRYRTHDSIAASYARLERDGRLMLQIDTYGRDTREIPGKQSQSIQLDADSAAALYEILKKQFGFK